MPQKLNPKELYVELDSQILRENVGRIQVGGSCFMSTVMEVLPFQGPDLALALFMYDLLEIQEVPHP